MLQAMLIISPNFRPALAGLAAFVACLAVTPALAQTAPSYPGGVVYAETPSAALARNVRVLAAQPRSFEALIGAGRAALALGDSQAAVGFFGRAEEVNPRHPAPKAGTGAALVAMEEPVQALGYFAEAMRLGANQASIGADRGLAYDLTAEPALAQADYRAALYGQDRDEARRRLALSLAMGKDRAGALAALAPLMARRDPATERVRAFVLAMVGDVAGARRVVEAAMPGSAASMEPFLHKLARMSPDQQVAAVHFGRFPDDSAIKLAAAAPTGTQESQRPAPKSSKKKSKAPSDAPLPAYSVPDPPIREPAASPPIARPVAAATAPIDAPRFASNTIAAPPVQVPPVVIATPVKSSEIAADAPVQTTGAAPVFSPVEVQLQPQPPPVETVADTSTPAIDRLSDIDRLLDSTDEPIVKISTATPNEDTATAPPASKSKADAAKLASKKGKFRLEDDELFAPAKTAKSAPKAAKSPGKYWVQLAGGSKAERMPVEYKRITGKKPKLFAKRTAYVAELKGWTRLLVGPFKSEDEAQDYVNLLAKSDIDGFSWASPTAQTIEKLPPK